MSPKSKRLRNRLMVYGGLLAAAWGFYVWQPYQFDIISKRPPGPNPPIDPESNFLYSGKAKVLLVTAHPDDSCFYIGGFLMRLSYSQTEIHQIICTDGDKGYYWFEDWQKNRKVRRAEALQEAAAWGGKDILFLGQPDGRLRAGSDVVALIAERIRQVKPDYLVCFDGEYPSRFSHTDHRRAGEAAWRAAVETSIPKWVMMFQTNAPNYVADISNEWDAQQDLLKIHESQFYGERLAGVTGMVGDRELKDGATAGYTFGEAFRCVRLKQ